MPKLNLDRDQIDRCRDLCEAIARPMQRYIDMHSTVAVERAVLRLLGFAHALEQHPGRPYPAANLLIEKMDRQQLKNGVASVIAAARKKLPRLPQDKLCDAILSNEIDVVSLEEIPPDQAHHVLKPWIDSAFRHVDRMRYRKEEMREMGSSGAPLKGAQLATGDVKLDAEQSRDAALGGADVVAVLRSTAQSLLDYVPCGETSEGYGGTFATQANFRVMREALDDVSRELGRYVRLSADSHGLCMPELAAAAAWEGVDYLVNDAFYGPVFRDLNVKRALVDQHFSRVLVARAGIVIHTAEDNYLSNVDAYDAQHLVLAGHFLNEQFAKNASLRDDVIGYTHAFDLDPAAEDSLVFETAMAQLVREVFPRSPLRYLPPSRRDNGGDAALSFALNALHGLAGTLTAQSVHYVPCPGDSTHPVAGRFDALKSAGYVFSAARSFNTEVQFVTNGKIMRRARSILDLAEKTLSKIKDRGLFDALEQGLLADLPRGKDGGRGFDGVFEKSRRYYNPFLPQSGGRDR